MTRDELIQFCIKALREEKPMASAAAIADFVGVAVSEEQMHPMNFTLLQWCLDNGRYYDAAKMLWSEDMFTGEPSSTKEIWKLYEESPLFMLMGAASMCFAPGTPCRMWDGMIKSVEEVEEGDEVCGDDLTPRRVLKTSKGVSDMFRVSYSGGEFICNDSHVLTLICSWERRNHGGRYGVSTGYTPGEVVDVPIREYLAWSNQRKRAYQLFFGEANFPSSPVDVDPYIYGAWIGDGSMARMELTGMPGPTTEAWCYYWESRGEIIDVVSKPDNKAHTFRVRGGKYLIRKKWTAFEGKRILPEYLHNTAKVRLEVLAGLIDTDGSAAGAGFRIVTKWPGLRDDILELARSLGFVATAKTRVCSIKSIKFSGEYHEVFVSGPVDKIPTKQKKCNRTSSRGIVNGRAVRSFLVTPVGRGEFFGFELDGNHRFLLGDGVVTHNSKSYSIGVRLMLEWVRDPIYTTIKVLGPSETHLEDNLFSHLVDLHRNAAIKLPGQIGKLFIGGDTKSRRGSITGVVVPLGKGSAGRLRGVKTFNRPKPHPVFGTLSRLIVFMDEMNKIPGGIWKDVDNIMVNAGPNFKIAGAFNPQEENDEVGLRCEPEWGWEQFDMEQHFRWKSKRGWDVLRLDADQCENIKQGKIVFPGLQTAEGKEQIIRNAGGYNTPGYFSMVRACFPPRTAIFSVIPQGMLHDIKATVLWVESPTPYGGFDTALEGGDKAVFAKGDWGLARGVRLRPTAQSPTGREVLFYMDGKVVLKHILLLTGLYKLPKGDTIEMGQAVQKLCNQLGVAPQRLCVDRTGNGAGVHDWLKQYWSALVQGVNFFESASERKIMKEDEKTPKEDLERMVSELWFSLKKWIEFCFFRISPDVDTAELIPQLTKRLLKSGKKQRVEPKKEYTSRGNESPNEADAVTLVIQAVRADSDVMPSMNLESTGELSSRASGPGRKLFHRTSVDNTYEGDL